MKLPPGQQLAAPGKWPIVGERTPAAGPKNWVLSVTAPSGESTDFTLESLHELSVVEHAIDVHCVTRWSQPAMVFKGVLLEDVLRAARLPLDAPFVSFVARSERKHSTSLPLAEALNLGLLLAWEANGAPLDSAHGGPLRSVAPGKYFYKSLKWLERIELLSEDRLGYWEREAGYHNGADPWREQRFLAPSITRQQAAELLRQRDFSQRDLRGLDARGHDLQQLDAHGALLRDADFRDANLTSACFDGANLSNARFAGADLRGASFVNADLEGADFCRADLRGADLTGASLFGTTFAPLNEDGIAIVEQRASWDDSTRFDAARLEDLMPAQRSLWS